MNLSLSKFTKINESFCCSFCGYKVKPSSATCRDHCPKCLHSIHVDNNPGDRNANCGGLLKPVGYKYNSKKGYVIEYVCEVCSEKKANRFLEIDKIECDSFEALLALTQTY